MDVKASDTNRALKRHVAPLLEAAGFTDATGRKYWRRDGDRIDHVEIAGLSSYRALTDNATTASFHVRLGISLPHYGIRDDPYHRDHIPDGPSGPRPRESQMPIRGVLCPAASPPLQRGRWGWECRSLWRVLSPDEAEQAALDLRRQFDSYALDWMHRRWEMEAFLELLQSSERRLFIATADNGSHLELAAEMPGSPIRQAHIRMVKAAIKAGG